MNSTFHWVRGVALAPHGQDSDLYDVAVRYDNVDAGQYFKLVHIPQSLKAALLAGPVGFQLETLTINSAASRTLPGAPLFAIVAVQSENGVQLHCVPREWRSLRSRQQLLLVLVGLLALLMAWGGDPSHGLLGLVMGAGAALIWASMTHSRVRPFVVLLEYGKGSTAAP